MTVIVIYDNENSWKPYNISKKNWTSTTFYKINKRNKRNDDDKMMIWCKCRVSVNSGCRIFCLIRLILLETKSYDGLPPGDVANTKIEMNKN